MKNILKFAVIFIFVPAFITSVSAQEKPKAILIDSFGNLNCEDVLARTESFMYQLYQEPNSIGYAVIRPSKISSSRASVLERIIKNNIRFRRFDKSRIVIVRSESVAEDLLIEFWKVPLGGEKPPFVEAKWTEIYGANWSKPFVYGSVWFDSECPTFVPEDYAAILKQNSFLRGHVVIFNDSKREARASMRNIQKLLIETLQIPQNRLRFFFAKRKPTANVEFWIVPQNNK